MSGNASLLSFGVVQHTRNKFIQLHFRLSLDIEHA